MISFLQLKKASMEISKEPPHQVRLARPPRLCPRMRQTFSEPKWTCPWSQHRAKKAYSWCSATRALAYRSSQSKSTTLCAQRKLTIWWSIRKHRPDRTWPIWFSEAGAVYRTPSRRRALRSPTARPTATGSLWTATSRPAPTCASAGRAISTTLRTLSV